MRILSSVVGISLFVLPLTVSLACSSDKAKDTGGDSGNKGNDTISLGTGGGSSSPGGSAVNPDPLPADETDGWIDIDADTRAAFLGDACDGWSAEPESNPSVIEFVLDVSGTMNGSTDATGDQTKWEVSRDALLTSLEALPANISVGITFYPNKDNGGAKPAPEDHSPCIETGDNVAPALLGSPGSNHRQALIAALNAVEPEPDGATPTHDAMNIAYDVLNNDMSGLAKYVVLVTDGEPTLASGCYGMAAPREPDAPGPIIDEMAARLAADGIRTFVVGSPGSEVSAGNGADVRDWLSAAARAGGTDAQPCSDSGDPAFCHFDLTEANDFGAALTSALGAIGNLVLSCDYVLPVEAIGGGTIDPNLVNIIFTDGEGESHLLLPNGDPDCPVGWHYTDDGHTQIAICGATCNSLKSDPEASLDLAYGCVSGTLPVR